LGEGYSGNRAYLGAVQSAGPTNAAWAELLDSLEIPEQGKGSKVLPDGHQAIISALCISSHHTLFPLGQVA